MNKFLQYFGAFTLACITVSFCIGSAGLPVQQTNLPSVSNEAQMVNFPDFTPVVDKYGPAVVTIILTMSKEDAEAMEQEHPHPKPIMPPEPKLMPPPGDKDDPDFDPNVAHGSGSGFIVSSDGYIITNAHVVEKARTVVVHMTNLREYPAKVVGVDKFTDIAVIKIDAKDLPFVKIGDSSKVHPGQWGLAIGAPFGFPDTVTVGIISAINRATRDSAIPFIQSNVTINPGNSGGPLFNTAGEVIAVNSEIWSMTGGFEGISFSIPINIAMNIEQKLIKDGHVVHGRIGVVTQNVNQRLMDKFKLDRPHGAFIVNVVSDGPAGKAGMKAEDIVVAVNGVNIERNLELPIMISNIAPGTKTEFQVIRKGALVNLQIIVGEMTP